MHPNRRACSWDSQAHYEASVFHDCLKQHFLGFCSLCVGDRLPMELCQGYTLDLLAPGERSSTESARSIPEAGGVFAGPSLLGTHYLAAQVHLPVSLGKRYPQLCCHCHSEHVCYKLHNRIGFIVGSLSTPCCSVVCSGACCLWHCSMFMHASEAQASGLIWSLKYLCLSGIASMTSSQSKLSTKCSLSPLLL